MGHVLAAREYKLLLKASEFQAEPTLQSANAFWTSRIAGIVSLIDEEPEPFERVVHRTIRFWDTADCVLSRNDLILRTREEMDENFVSAGTFETTLKLRMPDQFVVATTSFAEDGEGPETKFEEDIGPLEVVGPGAGTRVIVPVKRSTRNRFSLSTTIEGNPQQRPVRLADVFGMFPGVGDLIGEQATSADLVGGSMIHEYAFKRAKAKFSDNIDGKFTLSLWCFDGPEAKPSVAELSFTCETQNGTMPGKAAHGAYRLFIAFQNQLADIVDSENASKTALALPKGDAS
ncbi:hypothetical protein [Ensifer sp. ENS11]|uniref:hypothetical protein n=1 Tax=Ensifer sp. ENS11 TaxID=2769291 RepID=UPI00178774AB|nr:hypothetical protein [Ensifer sp. ENS11]MBD9491486.1 hypothetical protein [Ensifer sp. ENS11]MDP9634651.1 hypothetical protein [Ensifer adhaerens]